jgi:hypothetical protein
MSILGKLYLRFWFATEFWLTPVDRRPYTFIFRDWIYRHLNIFLAMVVGFYVIMVVLSVWHGTMATIAGSLCSFLLAHLVWGSEWIEHQQEAPAFLGGK